jgi:hypothetical protein
MMGKWLTAYKKEALEIYETAGKIDAVKFLMGKRNQAQRLIFSLKNCKEMLEAWKDDKDYIPDAIKLAQYDTLKEERDLLIEALNKCLTRFEGIAGYGSREDYIAINEAKQLLINLKK